ncbi:MAG: DUF6731 family protein [Bryobacteraceae bacterium]
MHGDRRSRTVEKKVFFYRVFVDGEQVGRPAQFNFAQITHRLNRLPYSEEGRYEADEDDAIISCFVDNDSRIRFGKIRRSNLPPIADGPNVTAIQVPPQAGLFECCHVVYFGNGVIGAEFNSYAPRVGGRFPDYLRRKAGLEESIEILPIVRGSPLEAFRRLQSVRSITIKVATTEARQLANSEGGLIARIASASGRAGVEMLELTLGTSRGRARTLAQDILAPFERLLRMPNIREAIDKLNAKGYVRGRTSAEVIDLLEDDLVVSKQFLRETLRTKTLDSQDAYAKIEQAYGEVRAGL